MWPRLDSPERWSEAFYEWVKKDLDRLNWNTLSPLCSELNFQISCIDDNWNIIDEHWQINIPKGWEYYNPDNRWFSWDKKGE